MSSVSNADLLTQLQLQSKRVDELSKKVDVLTTLCSDNFSLLTEQLTTLSAKLEATKSRTATSTTKTTVSTNTISEAAIAAVPATALKERQWFDAELEKDKEGFLKLLGLTAEDVVDSEENCGASKTVASFKNKFNMHLYKKVNKSEKLKTAYKKYTVSFARSNTTPISSSTNE